jgi:hypothetical protein
VLLLAYNRPELLTGLIDVLRPLAPQLVYVVIDGPKPDNEADAVRVQATRDAVAGIDWTTEVHTRFRPVNVGLRSSVADAVSWATSEHGQVIVMEDDIVPGPHVIAYLEYMLEHYRDDDRVMHVSGYTVVPPDQLSHPDQGSRLTPYPESYIWATWDTAWAHYDDALPWPGPDDGGALQRITGSWPGAHRWAQNFADARRGRISSWAYRWIASIWARDGLTVAPNVNLTSYRGQDDGTHTVMRVPWGEQPLYDGELAPLLRPAGGIDERADAYMNRLVFAGTWRGVARGFAISAALAARSRLRARRLRTRA